MGQPVVMGLGRVWVSCPGCEEKYVVEVSRIPPEGGSMFCRICGGRVGLPPREEFEHTTSVLGSSSLSGSAAADSRGAEGTSGQAAAGDAAAPPRRMQGEITCPHCGRAFVPGSGSLGGPEPAHQAPEKKTVLIVEDTEFFLSLARDTLEGRYSTLCARSNAEALALMRSRRIDLIVLDLALEGEDDGMEILKVASLGPVPCLVFTARSEAELWGEVWDRLKQKGATDLLFKGMNIEEQLLAKVNALLCPQPVR